MQPQSRLVEFAKRELLILDLYFLGGVGGRGG